MKFKNIINKDTKWTNTISYNPKDTNTRGIKIGGNELEITVEENNVSISYRIADIDQYIRYLFELKQRWNLL